MLYERILDLLPNMHLERRLAERAAAGFAVALLLALPFGAITAAVMGVSVIHMIANRVCGAGLRFGASVRAAFAHPCDAPGG